MWIISLIIIMALITFILYKVINLFDLAFFIGAIITASFFFVTAAINDARIAQKFNEEESTLTREDFQPVLYTKEYCHITHINYTDEHQLVIDCYRFREAIEYRWSKQVYYRIDCDTNSDIVPFESYWVNGRHLDVIVIDGVLPCFKKVKHFKEKDTPFFYKMLLPKDFHIYKPKRVMGYLYVPAKPIILNGEIPSTIQYDLIDRIEKAGSI